MKLYQMVLNMLFFMNSFCCLASVGPEAKKPRIVKGMDVRRRALGALLAAESRDYILASQGSQLVGKNPTSAIYENESNARYAGSFLTYSDYPEHTPESAVYTNLENERNFVKFVVLPLVFASHSTQSVDINTNQTTSVKNFLLRKNKDVVRCQAYDDVMERVLPLIASDSRNIEPLSENVSSFRDVLANSKRIVNRDVQGFVRDVKERGTQAQSLDLANMPYCFGLKNLRLKRKI